MRPSRSLIVCVNHRSNPDNPSCAARGSVAIADALESGLRERGMALEVTRIHCFGQCERGPNLRLAPGGRFFRGVRLEEVPAILDALSDPCGEGDSSA